MERERTSLCTLSHKIDLSWDKIHLLEKENYDG